MMPSMGEFVADQLHKKGLLGQAVEEQAAEVIERAIKEWQAANATEGETD